MSVLEAVDLSIRFGGVQANRDVSVAVGECEIVGVIGPNGAGKTTLFNMITGFYTPGHRPHPVPRPGHHPPAGARAGRARPRPHVPERRPREGRDGAREPDHRAVPAGRLRHGRRGCSAAARRVRTRAPLRRQGRRPGRRRSGSADLLDTQVAGLPVRHAEAGRDRHRAGHRSRRAAARRAVVGHGAGGGPPARRHAARPAPHVRAVDRHDRAPRAARRAGLRLRVLPRLRPAAHRTGCPTTCATTRRSSPPTSARTPTRRVGRPRGTSSTRWWRRD